MQKIPFQKNWMFQRLSSEDPAVTAEELKKEYPVDLPHDAMLLERRSLNAPSGKGGAYFYGGTYRYTKRFDVPKAWRARHVFLEFEGVYQNAKVYVNGQLLTERPYGYSDFLVELTDCLRYGTENEICVTADNTTPNSRWYSGAGIYRDVWLYTAQENYIKPGGLRITAGESRIAHVEFDAVCTPDTEAVVSIYDAADPAVCLAGKTVLSPDGHFSAEILVKDARLWSAEAPYLYRLTVTLLENGQICDEAESMFGFRSLRFGTDGFFVNGQEVHLRGGCIHHDSGVLGACTFAAAEERKVRLMKEAGFNAVRSAHNPLSKPMLDACDRLGMYVMDESFDQWLVHKNVHDYGGANFRKWWEEDTAAMVRKDYSHPSVIMYSLGNEISELCTDEGVDFCRRQADLIRRMDPTRAVTAGVNLLLTKSAYEKTGRQLPAEEDESKPGDEGMPTSEAFNLMMNKLGAIMELMAKGKKADEATCDAFACLDVAGYNYAASRYSGDVRQYPNRVIVGSETLPVNLYKNWQKVRSIPAVIGDFMWTGIDNLGESALGTISYQSAREGKELCISSGAGVIDICGLLRPEAYWNRIIWGLDHGTVLAVEPVDHAGEKAYGSMWRNSDAVQSWAWDGCEGRKCTVRVFAEGHTVELFLNGKSLGKKNLKENKCAFSNVKYEAGRLEAVSYDRHHREISRSALVSASGKTSIRLTPECAALLSNGQDLGFIAVELTGENGIVRASSDQKLTVSVEGAGCLAGFGSANPYTGSSFLTGEYETYHGRALIVVRAGDEPGEIRVRVTGKDLPAAECRIPVVPISNKLGEQEK